MSNEVDRKSSESWKTRKRVARAMDEREFQRLLSRYPVVRSRNYCVTLESSDSGTSTSASVPQDDATGRKNACAQMDEGGSCTDTEIGDAFWRKLRFAAERKVGAEKAEKFVESFKMAHEKMVNKQLSSDAARRFVNCHER